MYKMHIESVTGVSHNMRNTCYYMPLYVRLVMHIVMFYVFQPFDHISQAFELLTP